MLTALFAGACTYDVPQIEETPTQGTADFTKMISVGNSLTAGFMNGALYEASQANSYPSIIAAQMTLVGGGTFNQPTFAAGTNPNGCYDPKTGCTAGRLYLKIVTDKCDPTKTTASPTPKAGNIAGLGAYAGTKSELNNFGVPGLTIQTALLAATGGPNDVANPYFNPYYARFATTPGTSTVIGDAATAMGNGGTFFTFWLGNNDVLGYATNGGATGGTDPQITSTVAFETAFNTALNAMLDANDEAKGAVANIPDVTSIPYFSTVKYNPIPMDNATATAVNGGFAGYNAVLDALKGAPFNYPAAEVDARKVSFAANCTNEIVIVDETLNDYGDEFDILEGAGAITPEQRAALVPYEQIRETKATDLITLSAGSVIGTLVGGNPQLVNGVTVPLSDKYVLIPTEIAEVQAAVTAFNSIIADAVADNSDRLVLVDVNAELTKIKNTSVLIKGSSITASITPPNGAFSLDGVHPNARGSAYIANVFIKAINAKFGSNIPLCNPNAFGGNELPVP